VTLVKVLISLGVAVGVILFLPVALLAGGVYKHFYTPAEGMMPTLEVGDRFVARMGGAPEGLRRGDIVLVETPAGEIYIKRLAGLPGDRIGVQDGVVHLNGRAVPQRQVGVDRVTTNMFGNSARRLSEQFPGEADAHQIYDSGHSIGDDYEEELVRPGHLFLLGDNRDLSADSRFGREEQGLEQVPLTRVRGVPDFFTFTARGGRFGEDAGH
jgi:signal peptidase I